MSFPTKEDRYLCWGARDRYWQCLEEKGVKENDNEGVCKELRRMFEKSCSAQWIKHFDRRRNYLIYKEKIEKQGYEPLDERAQEVVCRLMLCK